MKRYLDQDGHAWPLTDRFCAECGMPLAGAWPYDRHPLCGPPAPDTPAQAEER